ncbi:TPA: redoxin domain-containing protein [Candidatus Poribacteria bacterium]|nr:redoxin domain-containing protein [Candidatus Poribacteria bacterium]
MFAGKGGEGVKKMPSPHIEKMPKRCVECHMAEFDLPAATAAQVGKEKISETGGHTFKASISTCIKCHEDVEKLISDEKAEVEKLLIEVENILEAANDKNSESYEEAELNYNLVKRDRGYGFHNFRYAKALLKYSLSLREELLKLDATAPYDADEELKVSQRAPSFILKTLDGSKVVRSKKVFSEKELTVLIFWDTSCPECLETLASCQKFYQNSEKLGIGFWSINFDNENLPKIRSLVKEEGITFPILSDLLGVTVTKYKAQAYSFSFFIIDKNEIIRYVGYDRPPNVADVIKEEILRLLRKTD